MYKILVSDPLSEEGLKILKNEKEFQVDVKTKLAPEELKKIIKEYDALLVRSSTKVNKEIIEAATKLKVIGRAGVGLDNVDVKAASKRGIIVMNTPGGNTISTAEHTISMILSLSRNIPQAASSIKAGQWDRKRFMGTELYGKVLGIVGLGRIGSEVAKRANAFGMKILAFDPYLSLAKTKELKVESVGLKELFSKSDYITVHTPLTNETKHIISDKEFKLMKDGVRIINCARGGIIDEKALYEAMKSGKVAGCALDVFETEPPGDQPLVKLDNCVACPHLGASTEEAQVNVAIEIAKQVTDALLGRGVRNAVNVPSVDPEILKIIEPYINLAEKLGALQAQLAEGHITKVIIKYSGDITKHELQPITVALVKGLLTPMLQETVNYVNATVIAKERGIEIIETKSTQVADFANLILVEVQTNKGKSEVAGTLFTKKDARVVKINEFYIDAVPKGYMVVISNKDLPGVVGQIGTILGEAKINIAGMNFGREKLGGKAITVLNVDSIVSEEMLKRIKKADNIIDAKLIKL